MKFIIGIDEAGRGPLAGPVSVGCFGAEQKMESWLLKNIFENKLRDSKKLSPKKREEIYEKFLLLKKERKIFFEVSHISNKIIDKKGISEAVRMGIKKSISEQKCLEVRLDGLLKAPEEFKNQKTIIKGDEKDVFIACASIVAKVCRDRLVCKLARKYPDYCFEIHKGYGTLLHRTLIKKYGLCAFHRKTFCKNLTVFQK